MGKRKQFVNINICVAFFLRMAYFVRDFISVFYSMTEIFSLEMYIFEGRHLSNQL